MGVTIHFEGKLLEEDLFPVACATAREFAEAHNWPWQEIGESNVTLLKVRNEESFNYVGPTKGIEMLPHQNCEWLRFEFDENFYIQDWVKTQFAPIETHLKVVVLLQRMEAFFEKLEVKDEGEYYETQDVEVLTEHRYKINEVINEYLSQPDKYSGTFRNADRRIVDCVKRN